MEVFWKIFVPVITFILTGILGWIGKELLQIRKEAKEKEDMLLKTIVQNEVKTQTEYLTNELSSLRNMLLDAIEREEELRKDLMDSYKFRLMQLCREFIAQQCITQAQYDQLTEFYKLYSHLGGNGQGEKYYNKAIDLPIVTELPNPQDAYRGNKEEDK